MVNYDIFIKLLYPLLIPIDFNEAPTHRIRQSTI